MFEDLLDAQMTLNSLRYMYALACDEKGERSKRARELRKQINEVYPVVVALGGK